MGMVLTVYRSFRKYGLLASALLAATAVQSASAQTRVLGLDLAAWQGNISQSTWNGLKNIDNRDFVFLRSSRGGTTGFYNQSDPNNNFGNNTFSQRYDDPYFIQNITRATNAGMYAGPYHYARPDIIASTQNSGGVANTGLDEANHFIEMAGPWMRPGYLLPTFDLEEGDVERSPTQLAQFSIEFSDRIHEVYGIRPIIYTNGNYASILQQTSSATEDAVIERFPYLWSARPVYGTSSGNDVNESIAAPAVQNPNNNPKDSFSAIYGPWDDPPLPTHPWSFWQYKWTLDSVSYNGNLDANVANGGMDFLKDHLVPALWMNDASGSWTSLANWNSGQTPVAPVQGPGQVARVGPLTLPAERLPSVDDIVVLDRAGADITVTLPSGVHEIRRLELDETLNVTGGLLTMNYTPVSESAPYTARLGGPMSISLNGTVSAHTIQVDAAQQFTLSGGELIFDTINLMPDATNPAGILMNGDVEFTPLGGATAEINAGSGSGSIGGIDMGGVIGTFNVNDGAAETDLAINVPLSNGLLRKDGPGRLDINDPSSAFGTTFVDGGTLSISNPVLADDGILFLTSGSVLDLDFVGLDAIDSLFIDGVQQPAGGYGALGSVAPNTTPLITGSGILVVTSPSGTPGDFDLDGDVDLADLTLWQSGGSPAPFSAGDLSDWQSNFGGSPSSLATGAASTVPEPSSAAVCVAGLVAALASRRKMLFPRV